MTKRFGWGLIAVAAVAGAQVVTQLSMQQQLRVINGKAGQVLTVADNGQDVALVTMPTQIVLGTAAAPGCVAAPGDKAGTYRLPRMAIGVAVYRNGLRASMPGEVTISGMTLTLTPPIPGEVVLCDLTF